MTGKKLRNYTVKAIVFCVFAGWYNYSLVSKWLGITCWVMGGVLLVIFMISAGSGFYDD